MPYSIVFCILPSTSLLLVPTISCIIVLIPSPPPPPPKRNYDNVTLCCSIQLTKHRGLLLALGFSVVNPKESSFQVWLITCSCFWRLEHQFWRISLLNVLQRLSHSGMPDIRRPYSTKVVPRLWVPNHAATVPFWVISVLTHRTRIRCESLAMPFLHNLHHVTCKVFCPAELADIWSIFLHAK